MNTTHTARNSTLSLRRSGTAGGWGWLLALGLLWTMPNAALAQQQILVRIAPVVALDSVEAGQTFVGSVEPVRRSTVGSAVDGRVVELFVEAGQNVKKGDPLCQLLTEALEIQIAAARAELELRRQEHLELQNGSRPEEIQEAEARMLSAKAAADYAESKLARTRDLVQRNAASIDQLQDHEAAAQAAAQLYAAHRATYELAKTGPRTERIAQAQARVTTAEEAVNRLLDQLRKHTMTAPFDGYVVREYTQIGQWISAGEPVAELVEVVRVDVVVQVLETYLPRMRIGMPARVEIGALAGQVFEGQVTHIVPEADVRSRNFPVKIRLHNDLLPDGQPLIKPGMFARATLAVVQKSNVLMVPKDALVMRRTDASVYVFQPDAKNPGQGSVRQVAVRAGVALEGMIEVEGDLEADQLVVIEGNERLFPGSLVRVTQTNTPLAAQPATTAP